MDKNQENSGSEKETYRESVSRCRQKIKRSKRRFNKLRAKVQAFKKIAEMVDSGLNWSNVSRILDLKPSSQDNDSESIAAAAYDSITSNINDMSIKD